MPDWKIRIDRPAYTPPTVDHTNLEQCALDALTRAHQQIADGIVPTAFAEAVTYAALHLARTLTDTTQED